MEQAGGQPGADRPFCFESTRPKKRVLVCAPPERSVRVPVRCEGSGATCNLIPIGCYAVQSFRPKEPWRQRRADP
ncbi:MAG TPA: hypothetical protein PLQ87_03165, partial [Phycisphaerae bacterium]|nr:hypothetical protein [Phycisphaerae bacterium]